MKVYDFHCGIRGFTKEVYHTLELKTEGMEFATELIKEAGEKGLSIKEIPVPLKRVEPKENQN